MKKLLLIALFLSTASYADDGGSITSVLSSVPSGNGGPTR